MDVNTQVDPEPYQPWNRRLSFKGFALRVGIVLVGWITTRMFGSTSSVPSSTMR